MEEVQKCESNFKWKVVSCEPWSLQCKLKGYYFTAAQLKNYELPHFSSFLESSISWSSHDVISNWCHYYLTVLVNNHSFTACSGSLMRSRHRGFSEWLLSWKWPSQSVLCITSLFDLVLTLLHVRLCPAKIMPMINWSKLQYSTTCRTTCISYCELEQYNPKSLRGNLNE